MNLSAEKEKKLLKKLEKLEKELAKEYKNDRKEKQKTKQAFKNIIKLINKYEKKNILTKEEAWMIIEIVEKMKDGVL